MFNLCAETCLMKLIPDRWGWGGFHNSGSSVAPIDLSAGGGGVLLQTVVVANHTFVSQPLQSRSNQL